MAYSKSVFDAALAEINGRRVRAKESCARRNEEVERKVPEIASINRSLAVTGEKLFKLAVGSDKSNFESALERIRKENTEAQKVLSKLLAANGYPDDYLDEKYICGKCSDTGFVSGLRCDCLKKLLNEYAYKELNLSSRMELCSFDSFSVGYYPEKDRAAMTGVYNYCRNYADTFSLTSKSICMLGLTGLGKTHLSLAIAKEVIRKGYNAAYGSVPDFLRAIEKEHFGRSDSDCDTMELLLSADLLILDDLGAEFDTPFYVSTVYNIINTRLNAGLPTIISSNLSPQELRTRYTDRVVSRLLAMYDYISFSGEDIRQKKRMCTVK